MQIGFKIISLVLAIALASEWIQADEPISAKSVAIKLEDYIEKNAFQDGMAYLNGVCSSSGRSKLKCARNPASTPSSFNLVKVKNEDKSQIYSDAYFETGNRLEDSDPSDEKALWVIDVPQRGKSGSVTDDDQAFMADPDDARVKINFLMNQAIHVTVCAVSVVTGRDIKCINEKNETSGDSTFSEVLILTGVDEIFKFKFQFKSVNDNGLMVIRSVEMAGLTKLMKIIPSGRYCQLKNGATGHFMSIQQGNVLVANENREEISSVWKITATLNRGVIFGLASNLNQLVTRSQVTDGQLTLSDTDRRSSSMANQKFLFENNMILSADDQNKVVGLNETTGKVTLQQKTGKKNQIWLLDPPAQFAQLFNKLDFDPSVKITEIEVTMSPMTGKTTFVCKTNQRTSITMYANDENIERDMNKDQLQKEMTNAQIGKYKCEAESAVAVFDLRTLISGLDSNIREVKFTARVQEKRTEISYKRANASQLQFVCVQNGKEMDMRSPIVTHQGEQKEYLGGMNYYNNFDCDLLDGQKLEFGFVSRDVYPKIADFHFTTAPYHQSVKVWCSAVSDLIEPRNIPSKITIFFNDQEVASEYNINKVQFAHDNTAAGKYKCVVKNIFGEDSLVIENKKEIKKTDFGIGGGVFTAQCQPFVGTTIIHSTFDYDQKFTCKQYDEKMPCKTIIQKEEEINHFRGELNLDGTSAYTCHAKDISDEINLAVYK